jgi:hypothetical protein
VFKVLMRSKRCKETWQLSTSVQDIYSRQNLSTDERLPINIDPGSHHVKAQLKG